MAVICCGYLELHGCWMIGMILDVGFGILSDLGKNQMILDDWGIGVTYIIRSAHQMYMNSSTTRQLPGQHLEPPVQVP